MAGWTCSDAETNIWKGTLQSNFRGTANETPINPKDLVNKEYVDDSIPASISLFLTENGSDLGGVYLDMEVDPVTDPEEDTLTAISANSTGTLMATFATPLNDSVIDGIVELPVGVYSFHIHCQSSSAGKLAMYAELYHRNAGGTETLLLTSEDSNLIPIAKGSIGFHGSLTTEKDWIAGDRIIIKLYGTNNSAASRNLTIYVEGNTASRAELPAIRGSSVGAGSAWLLATNQTGITGNKTGTFNLETTGTGVFEGLNPYGNGTADLGSVGFKWRSLFLSENITITGNITIGGTVDGIDIATDVAANTLKETDVDHNVTTNLSAGTRAPTTIDVNSSDGTNATLVEADTTNAGILGSDKWDEIVANSLKETDVDHNVTTNLSLGAVNATTMIVASSDGTDATLIEADTTNAGLLGSDKWDEIVANTAASHAQNTDTSVANNAITLAMMAHGTDGNLITYDAAGAPAAVATGDDGQVLTSNGVGTAPTFQAGGGGGGTFYWSCTGQAFRQAFDLSGGFGETTRGNLRNDTGGGRYIVSVNLPTGAVITAFIIYGSENDVNCTLYRKTISSDTNVIMAQASMGTADTSISSATIDNSIYAYFAEIGIGDTFASTDVAYGCKITYTT